MVKATEPWVPTPRANLLNHVLWKLGYNTSLCAKQLFC